MRIVKQESATCRIVEKKLLASALGRCVCRQRKRWFGWITTAWLYSNQCRNLEDYIRHFDYEESGILRIGSKYQFANINKNNYMSDIRDQAKTDRPYGPSPLESNMRASALASAMRGNDAPSPPPRPIPFTRREDEVLKLLTEAHNAFCDLENIDSAEAADWSFHIRALQARLGQRQLRRDYPNSFK